MSAPVLAEARKLQQRNFACAGISIWGGATRKEFSFLKGWQKSQPETSLDFIADSHNGLILCTGVQSDVIAVDLDKLKPEDAEAGRLDGIKLIHGLIEQHGLPKHVPVQRSGTGGEHLLFSLSKSLQQGLRSPKNQMKIKVDGKGTTIDIRGDGGCLFVYPSSYTTTADGVLHEYQWVEPLGSRADLQAMPSWLISLINGSSKREADEDLVHPNKRRAVAIPSSSYQVLTMETVQKETGQIATTWPRPGGYDFALVDTNCNCYLCQGMHTSNHYIVRRIISTCFYLSNYADGCKTKVFGTSEVLAMRDLLAAPTSDDRVVKVLQLATRDQGYDLRYTGKQWLCFQGLIWEPLTDLEVKKLIKLDVNYGVIEQLLKILNARKNSVHKDEAVISTIDSLKKTNKFLMKASNVNSVAETAKQLLLDVTIAPQLDINKDILACNSGVIDLKTGVVRKASSLDYLSRNVEADYSGIGTPTPIVDTFFASIFNDDPEVIDYMQRLLGYAITGHTSDHKLVFFTGVGGNGKSLLLGCLSNLLGPSMFCTAAREVFFESGRPTAAGGHTAHLAPLVNKLVVAREEVNQSDRLDVALIKQMTGESKIVSRAPYSSEYVTFEPTHLPILACNNLPPIDVDDDGTLRRLVVVPFVNRYLSKDDRVPLDPTNPTHKLKDPHLKDKLATPEARSQLLTWLVKGATMWYPRRLEDVPQLLRGSLDSYIGDNGVLDQFIREECVTDSKSAINASEFNRRLNEWGCNIKQEFLKPKMAKRGFVYKKVRISGNQAKGYAGIAWAL